MNTEFFAFGETLWDCLPSGRHAGGAPFNVAAHLAQLGVAVDLISAVGSDPLGDEILRIARDKGIGTRFVTRARAGLATGTVLVTLDAQANAAYEIVQPAAWDEIQVSPEAREAASQARALVFGSLAVRSPANLGQLDRLLALKGPKKFFDVNLRPPFADPARVLALARRADVIKLNDDELGRLASYVRTAEMTLDTPGTDETLARACAILAEGTGASCICVTRGSQGAALWDQGALTCAPAPQVTVRDTVGAGDAFMAGFMAGLIRGTETRRTLETACRLGGYVASQDGATPPLPAEFKAEVNGEWPRGAALRRG